MKKMIIYCLRGGHVRGLEENGYLQADRCYSGSTQMTEWPGVGGYYALLADSGREVSSSGRINIWLLHAGLAMRESWLSYAGIGRGSD